MSAQTTLGKRHTIQPLRSPQTVGIWRLTGLIHEGRWCDLYAAQPADADGSPRSDYVLKTVRAPVQQDPEAARQVRAEAAAGTAARHPHLVPILDGALEGARPYVVMPRIEGGTLADLLPGQAKPVPVALWWVRQCAQAIRSLEAAGWVHGDVKPENLMVDARGHLTLIDYGFAQRSGSAPGAIYRGTPEYAAPERFSLEGPWHSAGDVYSLGKILRQLLPGHANPPESVMRLMDQMLDRNPEARPAVPELVETLLRLEIQTLHLHIQPPPIFGRRAA